MRRVLTEGRNHGAPTFGVGGIECGDPRRSRVNILIDTEPASIGKCSCKAMLGGQETETMGEQAILVSGEKWRARKKAQIHGVEVVAKAGPGNFFGLDRASGSCAAFDHGDLPTFGSKMQRRRQAVHASADDDCIVRHRSLPHFRRSIRYDGSAGRLPAQIFHI